MLILSATAVLNCLRFAAPAEATWRLRCSEAWRRSSHVFKQKRTALRALLAHQEGPRAAQETPMRLPRGSEEPPKESPKSPQRSINQHAFASYRSGGPSKVPRAPKSAPRAPQEGPKSAPRPLSLEASEHLNLQVASAGAAKRKQFLKKSN